MFLSRTMKSKRIFNPQSERKKFLWVIYILIPMFLVTLGFLFIFGNLTQSKYGISEQVKGQIIGLVREATEDYFIDNLGCNRSDLEMERDWEVEIIIYHLGQIKERGIGKNTTLSISLEEATRKALDGSLNDEMVKGSRFVISFLSPIVHSFTIYGRTGYELIEGLVAIRQLDKELISQRIEQAKDYLFRIIDKKNYGTHKYYYALDDNFEKRLHTIYTSSVIYSLLKIYDYNKDENISQYVYNSGEFILSMQNKDIDSKCYGAFHYSFYLENKVKENYFVVGTTSKTIFTLLELYNRTGDNKYLESAKLGANWLLTMQNPDGEIISWLKNINNGWIYSTKESYLYTGQVLSALSRIYKVTEKQEYYNASQKIAQHFAEIIEEEGYYLGDDYRPPNPISSSWVMLSLLDFYKISQDDKYKAIVINCSEFLIHRQKTTKEDLLNFGRWTGSSTTSGNGWLCEVMVEIYKFYKEQNIIGYEIYKENIIKSIMWLIQHSYSEKNSFFIRNPERANGGLIWCFENGDIEVRTDSVCHGVNGYVGIIDDLEDGTLISIPQKSFEEMLNG